MKMTNFSVPAYGFKFTNDFINDFVPAVDWHTGGLCGGMSYASLDYYYAKLPAPIQPFRPANGTPLHTYLYDRQVTSIESNIDKWTEIGFNPFGARNSEFFNWGLSAKKGERIDELKQFVDNGRPVVLGMQGDGDTGNHQVLAIGYDMGRYKGDLGAFKEDFKIFICDPNHPRQVMTLVPDLAKEVFCYGPGTETWRTYFVDKNYHAKQPPKLPSTDYPHDGRAHELALSFTTGSDDLRGGNDNVDLVVNVANGTQQAHRNINRGGRWIANYKETAEVVLRPPVARHDIRTLVVSTTFHGGIGGDNWDMNRLKVRALINGAYDVIATAGTKRFTGEDKTLTVPVSAVVAGPGQISKLAFTFQTGGDDLRGVNDNLNLAIHFRDGHVQRVDDANGGHRWTNNSTHEVGVNLNEAVRPTDVNQIVLETTFQGGIGGDNWDMNSVSIRALGDGVNEVLTTHGFKRFTGSDKMLVIPVAVDDANFVRQSVPNTMSVLKEEAISVTFSNTGTTTWTEEAYHLGLGDHSVWGIDRVQLPRAIRPGQEVTFSFKVRLTSPGNFTFRAQMVRIRDDWFGAHTPAVTVKVAAQPTHHGNECDALKQQDNGLKAEVKSLQAELRNAASGEKAALVAAIKQTQAKMAAIEQRRQALGCH